MTTAEVSINHKNIAITLSLIVIGILAGTKEHLPTISLTLPDWIPFYVLWIVVAMFVAWVVFRLIGTCGCMGSV
jgi:hypothetical protein